PDRTASHGSPPPPRRPPLPPGERNRWTGRNAPADGGDGRGPRTPAPSRSRCRKPKPCVSSRADGAVDPRATNPPAGPPSRTRYLTAGGHSPQGRGRQNATTSRPTL